jgi:hypothetical protein
VTVLGVDFKTHAIDLALLDDDMNTAVRLRVELAGVTAFDRARSTRRLFPSRRWLEDEMGVVLVGLEKPYSSHFPASAALMRLQGAIAVLLPPAVPVIELDPQEWRHELGLPKAGPKATKAHVRARVLELYPDAAEWGQDAIDAYAIAYAARAIDQRQGRYTHERTEGP